MTTLNLKGLHLKLPLNVIGAPPPYTLRIFTLNTPQPDNSPFSFLQNADEIFFVNAGNKQLKHGQ